jgi:hypothetical protein
MSEVTESPLRAPARRFWLALPLLIFAALAVCSDWKARPGV